MTRVSKRVAGLAAVATVLSAEAESTVSFVFPPDHENTTLRDDIFTSRDSGLR